MTEASEILVTKLEYYNQQGVRVSPPPQNWYEKTAASITGLADRLMEDIEDIGVEKPTWFTAAEKDARQFLGSLGFPDLHDIHLLAEDKKINEHGLTKDAFAIVDPYEPVILCRDKRIRKIYERGGEIAVGAVLAHELGHATADPIDRLVYRRGTDHPGLHYRGGFDHGLLRSPLGMFYEEGFAHFISGWYRRSLDPNYSAVIGIADSPPELNVPDYLHMGKVSGPDGYAIELMAWGLEQRGIMTANDFVAVMLETRSPDTRTPALRHFAQAIERLRPGLYRALKALVRSPQEWELGLHLVYYTVTAQVRTPSL